MYVLSSKEECFWVWRGFKLRWYVSKCTWNMGWHFAKGTAILLQSKLFHVACRSSSTTVGCRKQVSNSDIVLQSLNPGCHVSQWMQLQRKLQHHITTDCNRRVDDWKIQKREQVLPFVKVRKLTEYHNLMNSFCKARSYYRDWNLCYKNAPHWVCWTVLMKTQRHRVQPRHRRWVSATSEVDMYKGCWFCVGGGGHGNHYISKVSDLHAYDWTPHCNVTSIIIEKYNLFLYRSGGPAQVFLLVLAWLMAAFGETKREECQKIKLAYDNTCHLDNLKVAKKPLPLPGGKQYLRTDINKIIDTLHIKDKRCQEKHTPERLKTEGEHYNTMSCEQTSAWLSLFKKFLCAMPITLEVKDLYKLK